MRLLVKDLDVEYDFWLIQTHPETPLETETAVLVHGEHKTNLVSVELERTGSEAIS